MNYVGTIVRVLAAIIFLACMSQSANADVMDGAVQIQFMPEIKALYITQSTIHYTSDNAFSDQDEKAAREKYGLYSARSLYDVDEKNNTFVLHPLEKAFELDGKKMVVILNPEPLNVNPNGMCGALVDVTLTFKVNGKILLDNCEMVANECGERADLGRSKCGGGVYYEIDSGRIW